MLQKYYNIRINEKIKGDQMRVLFDNDKMIRTIRRISHEILERNIDL